MRISILKIPLLASLVLVPTASRMSASGDPPQAQEKEKKKVVISSPEKEVVVDGDRGTVWNDGDDPEIVADLAEFDDEDGSTVLHFHGRASGGYLGVRSIEMTPELRQHFGAPKEAGVLVGTVEPESPAAKAGLQVGDIITAVDGEGIESTRDLSRSVKRRKEGENVKVDVLRDRSKKSLSVTVVERKGREMRLGDFGHGMRGFRWKDLDFDGPALAPVPPVPPAPPVAPDGSRWRGLQEQLDRLEQRLKEIESRLPKQ